MFNESIRWIEQSLLDAKIGGEAALFFNIAPASAGPIHPPVSLGRAGNELFDDLEGGALAVACGRAGEQRANRVNGLAVAANDAANVTLPQLHFKDRHFAARNLREHHLVRILDELANDKLEKFFHIDFQL